jgi:RNA polymerase sigma factor (sigma-70 family)
MRGDVKRSRDDDASLLVDGPYGFERFYARHERAMLEFFARRVAAPELAADLTAETFARALAGRSRYDVEAGEARAWLYGIASHLLVDSLRAGRVEDSMRRRLGMAPIAVDDEAINRIVELTDTRVLLALGDLPEDQQRAVRGHIVEDRAYDELAAELHCSPSVVRKRVSRGLRALRNRLEGQQ